MFTWPNAVIGLMEKTQLVNTIVQVRKTKLLLLEIEYVHLSQQKYELNLEKNTIIVCVIFILLYKTNSEIKIIFHKISPKFIIRVCVVLC